MAKGNLEARLLNDHIAPLLSPTSTINAYLAFQQYQYQGMTGGNQWNLYLKKPDEKVNWCNGDIAPFGDDKVGPVAEVDVGKLPWPSGTFKFPSKQGVKGCTYIGSQEIPGTVECEGKSVVRCAADPSMGTDIPCNPDVEGGSDTIYPKVVCGLEV